MRLVAGGRCFYVFQERAMKIIITQPFWSSWWAILCYILLVIGGFYFVLRVINLRKQKNISDEKTQFFINTAHDIRTPLTWFFVKFGGTSSIVNK